MLQNISKFLPLSVVSFCFFTLIFHAAAYAQESVRDDVSRLTRSEQVRSNVVPTPTIFIARSLVLPQPTEILIAAAPVVGPTDIAEEISKPSATPTPSLLIKKSPTPTTVKITLSPTPTPTLGFTPTPPTDNATIFMPSDGGMDPEKLFAMANNHRAALGLAALAKDERTCSLAAARAPEIAGEMAAGTLHSGMYNRNLGYWNTENAIAMGPEEAAFGWWLSDYIHRKAIENPSHTVSCVACSGVYCVQEFTSYVPK
jgi:uncharacterized protein YkwD